MARLPDDQLKEEVTDYVLQCVMRHEAACRDLRKQFLGHEQPSPSLVRDAVASSTRLALVSKHLPTSKVQLNRMKPRQLRQLMVAVLEYSTRRLMDQACGADNSGSMNSTDAMVRTFATIELAQHALIVREWGDKL